MEVETGAVVVLTPVQIQTHVVLSIMTSLNSSRDPKVSNNMYVRYQAKAPLSKHHVQYQQKRSAHTFFIQGFFFVFTIFYILEQY